MGGHLKVQERTRLPRFRTQLRAKGDWAAEKPAGVSAESVHPWRRAQWPPGPQASASRHHSLRVPSPAGSVPLGTLRSHPTLPRQLCGPLTLP